MTIHSTKINQRRRLAYTPLVAAVVAGTLCVGTGTSGATTDADPASTATVTWRMHNYTDRVITGGLFRRAQGHDASDADFLTGSSIDVTGLKPGETRSGTYESRSGYKDYTKGLFVCHMNTLWANYAAQETVGDRWHDVYVFYGNGNLFFTWEGAYNNRYLDRVGTC
ncbi:hypothetical protein [Rhodococcus jostii]|uniref:hypothetical protein n=1 Tax=Rhodococcus jostii TaxID=132919 RepID=UPI00362D27BD